MRANAVVLGAAGLCLFVGAAPARAQNGGAGRSVLDGVYTEPQAEQGRARFAEVCANCHTGGQFAGPAFQSTWSGRNVRSLFRLVRTTMPYDNPGGLTREEYAAIIAYMLELNGYPPGGVELPADDPELSEIRFEPRSHPSPESPGRPRSGGDAPAGWGVPGSWAAADRDGTRGP